MDEYKPRPAEYERLQEEGCAAAAVVNVRLLVVGHSLHPLPNATCGAIQIRKGLPKSVDVLVELIEQDTSLRGDSLRWPIFGEGMKRIGKRGGCDLYVGIATPRNAYRGTRVAGNKLDCTQTGERGYAMAQDARKPAILLPAYNGDAICSFVREQMGKTYSR